MQKNKKHLLGKFILALTGTITVAICCFTPFLAILLAFIGFSFIVPYLDYILIPLLFVFLILTVISFRKWDLAKRINKNV